MEKLPFGGGPVAELYEVLRTVRANPNGEWLNKILDLVEKIVPPIGGGVYEEGFRDGALSGVDMLRSE